MKFRLYTFLSIMYLISSPLNIIANNNEGKENTKTQILNIDNLLSIQSLKTSDITYERKNRSFDLNYESNYEISEDFYVSSGINYNRYSNKQANSSDNFLREKRIDLGAMKLHPVNERFNLFGSFSLGIGSLREGYPTWQNETENYTQTDYKGLQTKVDLSMGVFYDPLRDGRLVKTEVGYNWKQDNWDKGESKDRFSNFYLQANPAYMFGCDDYLCNLNDKNSTRSTGLFDKGDIYINQFDVGMNVGRKSYDADGNDGSKYNVFGGGIDVGGRYYVTDDVAARARFGIGFFGENQINYDFSYRDTEASLGVGVQGHIPADSKLNNIYGYADVDLGSSSATRTNMTSYKTKSRDLKFSAGIGYHWLLTDAYGIDYEIGYSGINATNKTANTSTKQSGLNAVAKLSLKF